MIAPFALLAAAGAQAKPAMPWPSGLYSNVHTIGETGDILGLEIRFYEEAGRHMAELANCEGWCNDVHIAEVTRGDNGFILGYTEMAVGAEGSVPIAMHFVIWPAGRDLAFSTYQGRENIDPDGKPRRLCRTNRLFGIAVAKSGKE